MKLHQQEVITTTMEPVHSGHCAKGSQVILWPPLLVLVVLVLVQSELDKATCSKRRGWDTVPMATIKASPTKTLC